jgi:hypothetical protein
MSFELEGKKRGGKKKRKIETRMKVKIIINPELLLWRGGPTEHKGLILSCNPETRASA